MHYFWALKIRLGELSSFLAIPPKRPLAAAAHEQRSYFFFKDRVGDTVMESKGAKS